MASVRTTEGKLHTSDDNGSYGTRSPEQLESIATTANAEAEKLGIKTRYEVVD